MNKLELWQTERLRLTLFPREKIPFEDLKTKDWWKKVTNTTPESQNAEPKIEKYEERGIVEENINLILSMTKDRIDWILAPIVKADL
jgi:hypothetical protein